MDAIVVDWYKMCINQNILHYQEHIHENNKSEKEIWEEQKKKWWNLNLGIV